MKKFVSLALITFATLLVAVGCSNETKVGDEKEAKEVKTEVDESITLGLVPTSQSFEEVEVGIEPFASTLSEKMGVDVNVLVVEDFETLANKMKSGDVDVAFMASFSYVKYAEEGNFEAVLKAVRYGSSTYKAQYNVKADSAIESIDDLVAQEGLIWAVPDKNSTSGFLFPAGQMMDKGIENVNETFIIIEAGGHDGAIKSLLNGDADFATTFVDGRQSVKEEYPTVLDDVKVIGYSNEIPNDNISVRKDLDASLKAKIVESIFALNDSDQAMLAINEVYAWDGISEATDSDYDIIRSVQEKFPQQ